MTGRTRDVVNDFLAPALRGLSREQAEQVTLALDIAIWFGVLEAQSFEGDSAFRDVTYVEQVYWEKVRRLRQGVGMPT